MTDKSTMTICEKKSCNESKKAIEALLKRVEELEGVIQEIKCPYGIVIGAMYRNKHDTSEVSVCWVLSVTDRWVLAHSGHGFYRKTLAEFVTNWEAVPE